MQKMKIHIHGGAGAVGLSVTAKPSAVAEVHAVCQTPHVVAAQGFTMTGIRGNGAVAEKGRLHGIAAPSNTMMAGPIRCRESRVEGRRS